jgi:hypothetical protein
VAVEAATVVIEETEILVVTTVLEVEEIATNLVVV